MNIRREEKKERFILAGHIPKICPNFHANATSLADKKDKIRATNPANARLQELGKEINQLVAEDLWRQHVSESDMGTETLWSTIRNLSNPRRIPLVAINFYGFPSLDPTKVPKRSVC